MANSRARQLACALLFMPAVVAAETSAQAPDLEQSFRSCSMITSELLTALQFHQQGLTLDQLSAALPIDSAKALERIRQVYELAQKEGHDSSYQTLNGLYQRCAQSVYDRRGAPARNSLEFGFYYCSGENKLRYDVLKARASSVPLEKTLGEIPKARQGMAKDLYALTDQHGLTSGFEASAGELKNCLNEVLGIAPQTP